MPPIRNGCIQTRLGRGGSTPSCDRDGTWACLLLRRIEAAYLGCTVLIRQVQPEAETTINVRLFQAAARVLGYGYSYTPTDLISQSPNLSIA
jgi:hypothetical protein